MMPSCLPLIHKPVQPLAPSLALNPLIKFPLSILLGKQPIAIGPAEGEAIALGRRRRLLLLLLGLESLHGWPARPG